MKELLIFNHKAAKGASIKSVDRVIKELEKAGIEADAFVTEHRGHAIEMAKDAVLQGAERIIVCGGDGTVNEAVNGMVLAQKEGGKKAALAIIPSGRGNDFCYCMNIPKDLKEDIAIIKEDHRISIDLGVAGDGTFDRYFCNSSGFGVDSAINYHAANSYLNGFPSYVWGVVKALFTDLSYNKAHFTIDGEEFDTTMVLFTAMNGMREGGGFVLAPKFSLQDGKLDLCILGNGVPPFKIVSLIPRLFSGNLDHPDIRTQQAQSVHIQLTDAKKGLFSQVDGETIIKNGKEFFVSIAPYKIDLVVKKPVESQEQ